MAQPPSMGVLAHLGTNADTTATPAAASTEYEFLSAAVGMEREIIRNEGTRGTRMHPISRVRQGRKTSGGVIEMEPSYTDLVTLLPLIVGAAAATVHTVSDTVPVAFQLVADKVAKVMTYTGCRTSRATFKGAPGQPLSLTWEIEALTESVGNAGTFASLTISNTPPFVWHEGVLTLAGTAYEVMSWEMVLDWHLKLDRFVNSVTRTDLPSMDVTVMNTFTLPYTSDDTSLYDLFTETAEVATGSTGDITFTKGGVSCKFAWAGQVFPAQKALAVQSRDEITLPLVAESRRTTAGVSPLVVTLDSTV